jgi:hypothetical protein
MRAGEDEKAVMADYGYVHIKYSKGASETVLKATQVARNSPRIDLKP